MITPSGNTQVGTGGARRVPVAPPNATDDGPPLAINVSLSGLLLLFVASRLLYLVLIDPSHLSPQLYDELYIGTIAQELVTGLTMPFAEYRANNYMLGTLVMGGLASGFFLMFGPTVFALKLASLLVFTLALVLWYWTLQRYAGERVAMYFALLFCCSPPLLTAYSVATLGGHAESILFSALTVFLLFRMLAEEEGSWASPALLGLTAGFGLWFTYIYGLTLLATLGFWFWYEKRRFWTDRVLWVALGFLVGFAPWIIINTLTHFAGLVVQGATVWEHFGLAHLWEGLAHPRKLAPYEFFAYIASDDPHDLPRRAVNLLYSLLYLSPILTAGVLHLKAGRSNPTGPRAPRLTLVRFSILYVIVFTLAVQFSDFRATRYHMAAYPFLFFLVAHSLARCQDAFPNAKKIQISFLASVVVLGLGTHMPLLSLDQPGVALSAKGYAYAFVPSTYRRTHAQAGSNKRDFILEMVQRPFLSDFLPKLSSDDQRDLSLALVGLLAAEAPLSGEAQDIARIERLVPPGFERDFYYQMGVTAMYRHPNELPQAVTAVEVVRHRSAAAHHMALFGTYRSWPLVAALNSSPESLANSPAPVAPELQPHYWRALGLLAGRYWYEKDQSLSRLIAHLQVFVPRLDISLQRYVLQGVGELLFVRHISDNHWVAPAELERFPRAYQEGLLEGWGMALGEDALFPPYPWEGHESLLWRAATQGFSARSLVSIRQGKAQVHALFEGPAASALEPPRQAQ